MKGYKLEVGSQEAIILNCDVMEGLRVIPDESVHCCVTSPPYWGLRQYGVDGQIGQEKSPDDYVKRLVEVFREVRRVLRSDGILWLNLSDTYSTPKVGNTNGTSRGKSTGKVQQKIGVVTGSFKKELPPGLKPKNLVGIPWRTALALQEDGWYLRQDVLWSKGNPQPESVLDRCTRSHEYIFLLSKEERYFFDSEAIKEDAVGGGTRNRRSVWTINTKSFKEAHAATFPPELPLLCIEAGTSEKGCCDQCGAPMKRVLKVVGVIKQKWGTTNRPDCRPGNEGGKGDKGLRTGNVQVKETAGWKSTCKCEEENLVPCTVLDPFSGAATTGLVALQSGRSYIGIELSAPYTELSKDRLQKEFSGVFSVL